MLFKEVGAREHPKRREHHSELESSVAVLHIKQQYVIMGQHCQSSYVATDILYGECKETVQPKTYIMQARATFSEPMMSNIRISFFFFFNFIQI